MKRKVIRNGSPDSLVLIADYIAAIRESNNDRLIGLRTPDFVMDFVYRDAFKDGPFTRSETSTFWPAWFAAFPERDYEVTRTIAAADVVVVQWVFTGTHTKELGRPIFDIPQKPSGRTVCFRGVTIYDVDMAQGEGGLVSRETIYLDLATIMVELGVTP
jgi:predicted ester cyclase